MKRGKNPNSLANLKPATKGEVRNPSGKPSDGKLIARQLLDSPTKSGKTAGIEIMQKQIELAMDGDIQSAIFVYGYAYGRPGQQLDVSVSNKAEEIASMFPTQEELETALIAKNNP